MTPGLTAALATAWYRLVAHLTRCPCRDVYFLEHRTRTFHVRNDVSRSPH